MKKIRESFHMIAATVFCIIMSMRTRLFFRSGQAMGFNAEELGYATAVLEGAGNFIDSLKEITSGNNHYIRKVFFWLKGPGDRNRSGLSGTPPITDDR